MTYLIGYVTVYGKNLLVAWTDMKTQKVSVQLLDAQGKALGPVEDLPGAFDPHEDLKTLPNGDLVFAAGKTGEAKASLSRIRYCD